MPRPTRRPPAAALQLLAVLLLAVWWSAAPCLAQTTRTVDGEAGFRSAFEDDGVSRILIDADITLFSTSTYAPPPTRRARHRRAPRTRRAPGRPADRSPDRARRRCRPPAG